MPKVVHFDLKDLAIDLSTARVEQNFRNAPLGKIMVAKVPPNDEPQFVFRWEIIQTGLAAESFHIITGARAGETFEPREKSIMPLTVVADVEFVIAGLTAETITSLTEVSEGDVIVAPVRNLRYVVTKAPSQNFYLICLDAGERFGKGYELQLGFDHLVKVGKLAVRTLIA